MNQKEKAVLADKELPPTNSASKDLEGETVVESVLTSRAILEGNIKRANEGDMRGDDRVDDEVDLKPFSTEIIITEQPIYKSAQQFGSIPGGAAVSEGAGNFLLWPSKEVCKKRGRFLVWPANKIEPPFVTSLPPPTEVVFHDNDQDADKKEGLE